MNVTDKIAEVYSVDGDEFSELNIKKKTYVFFAILLHEKIINEGSFCRSNVTNHHNGSINFIYATEEIINLNGVDSWHKNILE